MSYRITTDSTCDLPFSYLYEHQVACIGMTFQIGGQEYTDGPDVGISSHDFYDRLRKGGVPARYR